MINKQIIEEIKNTIIQKYDPLEIYIFGSYAWGHPDEESDLDILIVVDQYKKTPYQTVVDAHGDLKSFKVPKDIIVFTKEYFEENAKSISTLSYKIKSDGKRIYAKA